MTLLRALVLIVVCAVTARAQGSARRVLLVDLDDVGYDLLQATPTPTLDALAARGRVLRAFYVAPVCSPTRAMLNMGAYGSHPDVLVGQVVNPNGTFGLRPKTLVPLASAAARAGYATAKVGKWHLAPSSDMLHPHTLGWQHYAGAPANLQAAGTGYMRYRKVTDGVASFETRYVTTDETDDALALVRGSVDLVSVSYHAPHAPWHEPPGHLHSIAPLANDYDRARAMLQAVDTELARLLGEAFAMGYTIVVFADNGTAQPLGGGKGTVFDAGVRVPCVVAGPGVMPGVDDTPCGVVDLYATVLDWLLVPRDGARMGPHSRSLVPLLAGLEDGRRWVYTERFVPNGADPHLSSAGWPRAVRGARYKLVRDQSVPGDQLFDLVVDPTEQRDLLTAGPLSGEAAGAWAAFRDVMQRL